MERSLSLPLLALFLALAAVGAVALPDRGGRLVAAADAQAVRALQAIALEQHRLRQARVVDRNGDGAGEFAYLPDLLSLPRHSLPHFTPEADAGVFRFGGYRYRLWLPGPGGVPLGPDRAAEVAPLAAARAFLALAWPEEPGRSGERTYAVNQDLLVFESTGPASEATRRAGPSPPVPRLALVDPTTGKNLLPAPPPSTWPVLLPEAQRKWYRARFRDAGVEAPAVLAEDPRQRAPR